MLTGLKLNSSPSFATSVLFPQNQQIELANLSKFIIPVKSWDHNRSVQKKSVHTYQE